MATHLLSSPSEPLGSVRPDDARVSSSATSAHTPMTPALILSDDAPKLLKPRRRHRMPVFSFAARDLSIESLKSDGAKNPETLKSDAAHLIEMGLHFFRKDMAYEAISLYRKALTHAPDSALGYYLLGIALKSLKQDADARCAWKAAIASCERGDEAEWARERATLLLSRPA